MNYLINTMNILLLGGLLYNIYNNMFLKEGLQGCPANSSDKARDRERSAQREEIDNTISNLKAEIKELNSRISDLNSNVSDNRRELEKVSDAAARKAKETQKKMDKAKG